MKELCFKAILLCFCLLLGFNAFAYDAEIDGIYYNFSGDEATVTFKHLDDTYKYHSNYSGNILIPEVVSYNGKTYSITTIGDYAFSFSNTLISVSIPKSVIYIGSNAFTHCRALTSVTIPESVTSIGYEIFSGCNTLTSIDIPNSVTNIGERAFRNCSGLTSVTIPNSVTNIGYGAFMECM